MSKFITIAPTMASNKINNDKISHKDKLVYNILPTAVISILSTIEPSQEL